MTREEHYIKPSKVTSNKGVYYYNKAVDNCFYEFENRTCKNCKYSSIIEVIDNARDKNVIRTYLDCIIMREDYDHGEVDRDFGCNKWEMK